MHETVSASAAKADASPDIPSAEEVIERACSLIPKLRERAALCEQGRRIPEDNLDEMKAAGLFKMMMPKRYGGYEMDWNAFHEVALLIASGCGSTGWIYGVVGAHPLMVTNFGFDVQDEVWGPNPPPNLTPRRKLLLAARLSRR